MRLIVLSFLISCTNLVFAQDTFSIVAVDDETGEVGSAGASCLDDNQFPGSGGAYIISDILPGIGAIHTQSFYLEGNQANARMLMEDGKSPAFIINFLQNSQNDVENNSAVRQYGIAGFSSFGTGRAAAFTGTNCFDYKGQIVGTYYAIQGNILLGPEILDSMEVRFLNTNGTLADKLMAAIQGANVPGADTRCLNEGVSSLSAFLRVARPDDAADDLYLDLNVPFTPFGVEPIDELQTMYDNFLSTTATNDLTDPKLINVYPNPANTELYFSWANTELPAGSLLTILDATGRIVFEKNISENYEFKIQLADQFVNGLYFYKINTKTKIQKSGKFLIKKKLNNRSV